MKQLCKFSLKYRGGLPCSSKLCPTWSNCANSHSSTTRHSSQTQQKTLRLPAAVPVWPLQCIACFCYHRDDDVGGGCDGGVGGDEGDAEDYSDLCPSFALLAPPPPPPLAPPLLLLSRQSPPPRTLTLSTVLKWRHISFCSICMFWKYIYNRDSLHICFKRRIQPAAGLSPTRHLVGGQIICKTEFVPCTCKHKDILCEQTQRYFVQAQTQPQTQQLQLPEQL